MPNSVAQRVITEVEKQKRGIILFHDIHKVGLDALPVVIETLQADGYKFVSWNGTAFGPAETRGDQPEAAAAPPPAQPYRESWAAIIGIDDYVNWQKLQYAAHDAQGVKDLLIQKYNFKPDHVFTLLNGQATRQNILSLLGDKLGDPDNGAAGGSRLRLLSQVTARRASSPPAGNSATSSRLTPT